MRDCHSSYGGCKRFKEERRYADEFEHIHVLRKPEPECRCGLLKRQRTFV